MRVTKQQGLDISLSTLATLFVVIPSMWFLVKPLIATSLASDIQETVATQVQPISNAFVALLVRDINTTKREIAALEYRERRAEDWTAEDATYLADKEIELSALEEAKAALEDSS